MSKRTEHVSLRMEPEIVERVRRIADRLRIPISAVWMYLADILLPQLDGADSWPPSLSSEQLAAAATTASVRPMRAPPVPRPGDAARAAPTRAKPAKNACTETHPTEATACIVKAPHEGVFHSDGQRQWINTRPPAP